MTEKDDHIDESKLLRYINVDVSAVEKSAVEQWLASSPENQKLFDDLKKTWTLAGKLLPKPVVVDVNNAWSKVSGRINMEEKKTTRVFNLKTFMRVAATLVVLVGAVVLLRFVLAEPEMVELNANNEVVVDTLQDGSVIALNMNSTLTYPGEFDNNERRVILNGEAFFEIEPDKNRPFIIELQHESTVTVLGTSFNIDEKEGTTEVFVKTGKVEFKSSNSVIILLPGEKGILDHQTGIIEKAEPEKIDFNETFWLDQKLEFNDEPLMNVIDILSQAFETEISISDSTTLNCPLTTKFERESLEQILQVISTSFNLEVEQSGDRYILTGDGC